MEQKLSTEVFFLLNIKILFFQEKKFKVLTYIHTHTSNDCVLKDRKMQILQPIRNIFSFVGIAPYQKQPFNMRNVVTLFMLGTGVLLNCVHLFYEASTFKEYTDSVCASSSMVVAIILFAILIWKTLPMFSFLNNLEESVTKSK